MHPVAQPFFRKPSATPPTRIAIGSARFDSRVAPGGRAGTGLAVSGDDVPDGAGAAMPGRAAPERSETECSETERSEARPSPSVAGTPVRSRMPPQMPHHHETPPP